MNPTKNLLNIFWKYMLWSQVIFKNILAPKENYLRELLNLMLLVANFAHTK